VRRVDDLITAARLISRNAANPDGTYSIPNAEIIQYLNDAQDRIQSLISSTKNIAKIFTAQQIISVVGGQEDYTITDRVLLNKQLEYVEFSIDGQAQNYIHLEKLNYFNRDSYPTTYPYGYIKSGGKIKLCPVPSASLGTIRVSFERELDDLDKTRAAVLTGAYGAKVLDLSSTIYTPTAEDVALFVAGNLVSLSTYDGTVYLRNAVISSYNAGTADLTLVNNVETYLVDSTTPAASLVGTFLSVGPYTTVFPTCPNSVERYLIHYAATELFHRDSSADYTNEAAILGQMEEDIVKGMASQTGEIQFTPQLARYEFW
jgi:hypothetical protein